MIMAAPRLIGLTAANAAVLPCCGIKDLMHPGRIEKLLWLRAHAKSGVRGRVLLAPDGHPAGYVETVPGENAWRGVNAEGYLFIHCVWVHARQYQKKGWGRLMVEACLEDAQAAGMQGAAVLVREGPWMAGRALFLACGFEPVDAALPDYQLLVRKFHGGAPTPTMRCSGDRELAQYGRGLTLIRCGQCPYLSKFTAEIAETALAEYGMMPRIVELRSAAEAQNAPTPYAVFSLLHDGRLLADHQISRTRFRNIMNKLTRQPGGPSVRK